MRSRLLAGLAAGGALAIPAAAHAATLTADQPCYVVGVAGARQVQLTGAGFAPGQSIDISGAQGRFASGTSDAAGAFSAALTPPPLGSFLPVARAMTLTATDAANPTDTASVTIQVTNLTFATRGGSRRPQALRTWEISGFIPAAGADLAKPVYAHFRLHGHTYANYRFGVAGGPCGLLKVRAPAIPLERVRTGVWLVQIDQSRAYHAGTRPAIFSRFTVRGTSKHG
ncbi:MAG TPA: hypothetical protein VFT42_03215 [Solirubrobacteraceae bacterium]|nr:hypothetical protein [Solirubrobacteraceae bacterium]